MKNIKDKQALHQEFESYWRSKQFGVMGVITAYNEIDNTATVLVSQGTMGNVDQVLENVPCPFYPGVQMVNPQPGLCCYVIYMDNKISQPIISHYYSYRHEKYAYEAKTATPFAVPSYLV